MRILAGARFNHIGIPTTGRFEGEIDLPHLKVTVSDHQDNPFGIQWQRYWEDAPCPDLVKTVPHLAFEVDDLAVAMADYPVLIEPWLTVPGQLAWWSAGFGVFAVGCVVAGILSWHRAADVSKALRPPWQLVATWFALAATPSVLWLAVGAGTFPWIGLVIGLSFGAYGLLRKIAVIGALEGLTLESLILAPAALAAMAWWWGGSATSFPAPDWTTNLWLLGLGPATTVPLLLFTVAARRLPLTTLGLFQYLSPTIQFVLGIWLFAEPFTVARLAGFALIWAALALYTIDSWRVARRIDRAPAPER